MTEQPVKYASVNGRWPDGDLPIPTPEEAIAGARRLYRFGMGKPFRGKIKTTSGRRHTYIRYGVLYVNPNGRHFGGWRDIVHGLSHTVHRRKFPYHKPHDGNGTHAFIEREMIDYAVSHGFLEGALKRPEKKSGPSAVERRKASVAARLAAWKQKQRRAESAVRKLTRQARYYGIV